MQNDPLATLLLSGDAAHLCSTSVRSDDIYSLIARLTGDGFRCRVECPPLRCASGVGRDVAGRDHA